MAAVNFINRSIAFHEFVKEFVDLVLAAFSALLSERSCAVNFATRFALALLGRTQIALSFQTVKQGIESPGTDAVAVAGQFFHHAEPEDWLFHGVVQDVKADQARVKVLIVEQGVRVGFHYRQSMTKSEYDKETNLVSREVSILWLRRFDPLGAAQFQH